MNGDHRPWPQRCRDSTTVVPGFTIVELLVVAAILATLFGLVLAGSRSNDSGELRRAAQQLASLLLAAQSRGLGNAAGSAIVLESEGDFATRVFNAELPPAIRASITAGMPPANPASTTASVTIDASGADLNRGFRIQFLGKAPTLPPSPWFAFQPPNTVRMRSDDGQTQFNTAWPSTPQSGRCDVRIANYPVKGDVALQFAKSVAVELRYSGTGDDPMKPWGNLANKKDVGLSFDAVGAVDLLWRELALPSAAIQPASRQPVEPVYFFLATRNDIRDDTSLASERSLWVVVQPLTGRVTVSSNVPQQSRDAAAVRAARALARAATAIGK